MDYKSLLASPILYFSAVTPIAIKDLPHLFLPLGPVHSTGNSEAPVCSLPSSHILLLRQTPERILCTWAMVNWVAHRKKVSAIHFFKPEIPFIWDTLFSPPMFL